MNYEDGQFARKVLQILKCGPEVLWDILINTAFCIISSAVEQLCFYLLNFFYMQYGLF